MTEEGPPPRVARIVQAWREGHIDDETARDLFREAMLEDRRVEQMEEEKNARTERLL